MNASGRTELIRASIFHVPRNPFQNESAMESYSDGGLLIRDGRVVDCGDYEAIRAGAPDAETTDWRGAYVVPGFVDTHIHFPQVRVLGSLGRSLLEWLEHDALPEEAHMANVPYARTIADAFVRSLASHGTTTAMVFGSHFPGATAALFEAAERRKLRIVSGLVLSDRLLRPELHRSPAEAYTQSSELIRRFHGCGRLLYAVTPRFALSASEPMLEVCQRLMAEHEGLRFQTHMNENPFEVSLVRNMFPWASDYFGVYERFGLSGSGAVMAHNVHSTEAELERLAATGTAIAHCPCSNAALGSGIFPLQRHLLAGVPVALGTDVGGGTGFGMLKEGLQAYLMQRVAPEPYTLDASKLLYLATLAGAKALALDDVVGDFSQGKAADLVCLRPPVGSPLHETLQNARTPERVLSALFTLAGAESVQEVRVEGEPVVQCS